MPKRLPTVMLAAALALATAGSASALTGIPNFRQVTDNLYRGGQPLAEAWPQLAGLGVRTVIDLRQRSEHSTAAESLAVRAAGMRYVNYPMNGFATPTAEQMAQVLPLLDGPDKVFIHCKLGCDRTGTVVAAYRISQQRWDNRRALDEALASGLHWYEAGMKRFINGYRAESMNVLASAPMAAGQPEVGADSTGRRP